MATRDKTYNFNFEDQRESNLYQDLIQQYIDMYGLNIFYIPLDDYTVNSLNTVFNEFREEKYSTDLIQLRAIMEDMLIMGGNDIFSKFGYQVADEITLYFTRSEFQNRIHDVTKNEPIDILEETTDPYDNSYKNINKDPKIKDLIWTPMWKSLWQITYAEHQENMVLGYRTTWKIVCRKALLDANTILNINTQTGDSDEIINIINEVNNIDDIKKEEKQNINLEEISTQTGYDPTETIDVLNDDAKINSSTIRSDEEKDGGGGDIFSDW